MKNSLFGKRRKRATTVPLAREHLQELLPDDQEQHCCNNYGDAAIHNLAISRCAFNKAVHDFLGSSCVSGGGSVSTSFAVCIHSHVNMQGNNCKWARCRKRKRHWKARTRTEMALSHKQVQKRKKSTPRTSPMFLMRILELCNFSSWFSMDVTISKPVESISSAICWELLIDTLSALSNCILVA